jgi:hypothetical protein
MAAGVLRAAIKAGNWAQTAMQSRRQARALADLNARGGFGGRGGRGGPEGAVDYLRNTGVDPAANQRLMNTGFVGEGNYNPAYQSGSFSGYDLPGGGVAFRDQRTGAIDAQRFGWRDGSNYPIEAPYEGFRVWPSRGVSGFEPDWVGRGRHPGMNFNVIDEPGWGAPYSLEFSPYRGTPIPQMNVPRAFGGFDPFYSNNPARTGRVGRTIPFEEIMAAQGSLIPPRPIPEFYF